MNGPARRTSISRRRILQTLSIGGAGMALAGHLPAYAMQAARAAAETPAFLPLNRFPRMVQEFFLKREHDIHHQRLERLAGLIPEPTPKSTSRLSEQDSRCVRTVPRKNTAERARDESHRTRRVQDRERPLRKPAGLPRVGEPVRSERATLPSPWRRSLVRSFRQRKGHRDLSILLSGTRPSRLCRVDLDPIGQGERMQYVDGNLKPLHGTGTGEHNYAGIQQVLVDERFWMWRAWDGIRALDY